MTSIHLIGGEKGGVGKSFVARTLAQYMIDRSIPFLGFDTDRSHRVMAMLASLLLIDGLGGYKLVAALSSGHRNVGFLIALAVISNFILLISLASSGSGSYRGSRSASAAGTGVYFSTLLVPDLVAHLREIAPRVTLAIQAPGPDLLSSLDHGTTDIALGAFGKVPPRLMREQLFREELVWIARANSPLIADPAAVETLPPGRRLRVALGRPFPGHGSYS